MEGRSQFDVCKFFFFFLQLALKKLIGKNKEIHIQINHTKYEEILISKHLFASEHQKRYSRWMLQSGIIL